MVINTSEIRKIKAGNSISCQMETPKQLNSARTLAYHVQNTYPEDGKKFSCSINWKTTTITISAISTKTK